MNQLTKEDIVIIDKVIYGLADNKLDTIPEVLRGFQGFLSLSEDQSHTYRLYECFLVGHRICAIKKDWTPNSTFNGFKALQLDIEGYNIVRNKKSIGDFIKQYSGSFLKYGRG